MTRVLVAALAIVASSFAGAVPATQVSALETPSVTVRLLDSAGADLSDNEPFANTSARAAATVASAAGVPAGTVTMLRYASAGCAGTPVIDAGLPLAPTTVDTQYETTLSNNAGWDSATAWISNGTPQFDTNWFGSLFMGTDNGFFSSSAAGLRFTGLPLRSGDTVNDARLMLRMRRSRPGTANENWGMWTTQMVVDSDGNGDFAGLTRASFFNRFDSDYVSWRVDYVFGQYDPFASGGGAVHIPSPQIASLVDARISSPTWAEGASIAFGIINQASVPIAEAQLIDVPDEARLYIAWTRHTPAGAAAAPSFALQPGAVSLRAQYSGDAANSAATSACLDVAVSPADADRDGYSDAAEMAIGTHPQTFCAIMRADVDGDGTVTILDLSRVAGSFGKGVPPAPWRLDQEPPATRDGFISILDLARMAAQFQRPVDAC